MVWYDVVTVGLFLGGFLLLPILWELWDGESFRSLVRGSVALWLVGAPMCLFLVLDGNVEKADRQLVGGLAAGIAILMILDQLASRVSSGSLSVEESPECRRERGFVAYLRRLPLLHPVSGRAHGAGRPRSQV